MQGIDSDNGSEFINHHLHRYRATEAIQLTRGRSYKKGDNAHIEQKNWTHVRKLLGYVALAAVLASAAFLYTRSLLHIARADAGYRAPHEVLVPPERIGRAYEPTGSVQCRSAEHDQCVTRRDVCEHRVESSVQHRTSVD